MQHSCWLDSSPLGRAICRWRCSWQCSTHRASLSACTPQSQSLGVGHVQMALQPAVLEDCRLMQRYNCNL